MGHVTILRGISGSGKSTIAKEIADSKDKCIIVNRDKIRAMLFGSESDYGVDEDFVTVVENHTLAQAVALGYDVVVDNTHVRWEFVEKVATLVKATDPSYNISIVVVDTPLDVAIARNASRERQVPEHVIVKQNEQLQRTLFWDLDTKERKK